MPMSQGGSWDLLPFYILWSFGCEIGRKAKVSSYPSKRPFFLEGESVLVFLRMTPKCMYGRKILKDFQHRLLEASVFL